MSTSSSEEGSGSHSTTSSGLESTGSLLFSVPSDSSDVQTDITPSSSPAPSEGKMRTPRDALDASHRLVGQISTSALQADVTPTKPPKQPRHRTPSKSVANDEAGYDADGDGDGDGDEGTGAGVGADTTALTRLARRPAFLRIDTRQHRRVASMLASRCPSPGFDAMDAHTDVSSPLRVRLAPRSSIHLKSGTRTTPGTPTGGGGNVEVYELRQRSRLGTEPVGLGIGFPENHPLQHRAFTMPVPLSVSRAVTLDDPGPPTAGHEGEDRREQERRSEWLPRASQAWSKKTVGQDQVGGGGIVCTTSPVRLVLRPTFLEVSPSPIEYLPPGAVGVADAGTFRCHVDVVDRSESEVSERDHHAGHRRTNSMSMSAGCDAEVERERYAPALARGFIRVDGDAPR